MADWPPATNNSQPVERATLIQGRRGAGARDARLAQLLAGGALASLMSAGRASGWPRGPIGRAATKQGGHEGQQLWQCGDE